MPTPEEQKVLDDKKIADTAAEALRIASELEEKLNRNNTEKPKPGELDREAIRTATGLNDKAIDFVVTASAAASAESNARSARATVKEAKKDFVQYEKDIDKELELYPVEKRGNVEIVEKVYYFIKGKAQDKGGNGSGSRVEIRGGGNPVDQGLGDGGGGGDGGAGSLSKEESYVARKMGLSPEDYSKSKSTTFVHELRDK